MRALAVRPRCPLMARPSRRCPQVDEVLCGMAVELLAPSGRGWGRVRAPWGYEGHAPASALLLEAEAVRRWEALPKAVVGQGVCDLLSAPAVTAAPLALLLRGCLAAPVGPPGPGDWQRVALPDGREGYTKRHFLTRYHETPGAGGETALREGVLEAARSYLGAPYRWGGRTPLGIDCSGLASMSYLLNGVTIWRDAQLRPPLRPIPRAAMAPADLLFFPGHVALYLGEGQLLHATARPGTGTVRTDPLDPALPGELGALARSLLAVGSLF